MNDERWLEERLRREIAAVTVPPPERWLPRPERAPSIGRVLASGALVVILALTLGVGLRSMREDRAPVATAPAATGPSPSAPGSAAPARSYRPDPLSRVGLEADVRRLLADLRFRPLIPDPAAIQAPARPSLRANCGLAQSDCLDILWDAPATPTSRVLILQGPAGCCLDAARPNAVRDIEIRPGVTAQFDPVQPQFGGPILWWVESSSGDAVYVAISSPLGTRDELVRIARSMRSLVPPGFRDGRCHTGPVTQSARNGDYVFQTTGIIDDRNEFVFVVKRGAQVGDQVAVSITRLDDRGRILLPPLTAEPRDAGRPAFKLPIYKPTGEGCWQVDLIDGPNVVSYVVEVREP